MLSGYVSGVLTFVRGELTFARDLFFVLLLHWLVVDEQSGILNDVLEIVHDVLGIDVGENFIVVGECYVDGGQLKQLGAHRV